MMRVFLQNIAVFISSLLIGCIMIFFLGELYFQVKFGSNDLIDRPSAIFEYHEQRG